MASEIFFDQIEQNLISLINEKKLRLAHDKCLAWIQKFPDEKRFIKLKERIEEEVEEQNEDYVEAEMAKAGEFMNKGNYAEAIKTLQPLLKLTKRISKISKLIEKSQERYKEKAVEAATTFEKIQRKRLDKLFKENPETLLTQLFMMERENPGHKLVLKLTAEYRSRVIGKKINDKSDLLKSGKYDDMNHFIAELQKIDKDDPQIAEVINQIRIGQHNKQVNQQREHIYESQKQLITLMQLKKFDKAIKVAEEILNIDPSNKEVMRILGKAESNFFKQTKDQTVERIIQNTENLQSEYEADKEAFVKI